MEHPVGVKWLWDTSERLVSLPDSPVHSTIWDRKERCRPTGPRPTPGGTRAATYGGGRCPLGPAVWMVWGRRYR